MDRRERYLKHGERRVEGWLDKFSARYISFLDAIQEAVGETGAVIARYEPYLIKRNRLNL